MLTQLTCICATFMNKNMLKSKKTQLLQIMKEKEKAKDSLVSTDSEDEGSSWPPIPPPVVKAVMTPF